MSLNASRLTLHDKTFNFQLKNASRFTIKKLSIREKLPAQKNRIKNLSL